MNHFFYIENLLWMALFLYEIRHSTIQQFKYVRIAESLAQDTFFLECLRRERKSGSKIKKTSFFLL